MHNCSRLGYQHLNKRKRANIQYFVMPLPKCRLFYYLLFSLFLPKLIFSLKSLLLLSGFFFLFILSFTAHHFILVEIVIKANHFQHYLWMFTQNKSVRWGHVQECKTIHFCFSFPLSKSC